MDFDNKINAIILAYKTKLKLQIYLTNFKIKKIDRSIFIIYSIILVNFQIKNKYEKV